jgi:hypothetical protein
MTALTLACLLALLSAVGHSYLSERIYLRPLRAERADGVFSGDASKRLVTAMFHAPSLCWLGLAISMALLGPACGGYIETLLCYASIFAISGLGNFWATGRPHFGGVMLLSASGLILIALYT